MREKVVKILSCLMALSMIFSILLTPQTVLAVSEITDPDTEAETVESVDKDVLEDAEEVEEVEEDEASLTSEDEETRILKRKMQNSLIDRDIINKITASVPALVAADTIATVNGQEYGDLQQAVSTQLNVVNLLFFKMILSRIH